MNLYLQLFLFIFAGWVNRHQQAVIEYLQAENQVLCEQLGKRRIRWTDAQRRRLAAKAKAIGRAALQKVGTVVTPDTLLRWYGNNNILLAHGLEPAPERGHHTSWHTFIKSHLGAIAGADFFTVEVLRGFELVRYYAFFVIDIATRWVHIAGITSQPSEAWMKQVARNLTDCVDGFLKQTRHLILDRDPLYAHKFRGMLKDASVKVVRLPARSPNLNSYAERWVRSVRSECLARMIPLDERHLRHLLSEYLIHYHRERNHQGLDNRLIEPPASAPNAGPIKCRERLGGVLNFYFREAA